MSITQLAKQILSAIFYVENVPPRNSEVAAENILGTAFVIDASNGWLLTAKHVVDNLQETNMRARSIFSRGSNPSFAWGTITTVIQIVRDDGHDVALLQVHPRATKGRAIPITKTPMDIAEPVLLFGYAGGTVHTYCDDLLGEGSPKSPTPLIVNGIISALVPHDGRPIEIYVTDVTTHGGNSGGPVVSCVQQAVCAVHVAGLDGYGYSLPIRLGLDLLCRVQATK